MFPLVTPGKTIPPSDLDNAGQATLLTRAPELKTAADRVMGSLVKNLQKMAVTAGAIEGDVKEVVWRDINDVIASLSKSGLVSLVVCPSISSPILVTLDEMFVYGLVDLLCGGNGSENPPASPREATPIDQQFAQIAFTFVASAIETEWADAGFKSVTVTRAESLGSDLFGPWTTEVGSLDLSIAIFGLSGTVRLVVPPDVVDRFAVVESVAEVETGPEEDWAARLRQEIGQTCVKLDAYLDGKEIDLASLAALKTGQIITLPSDARSRVSLIAQGQVLFKGEIGLADDRYSLRIEEVVLDTRMTAPIVAPISRFQTSELLRA